MRCQARGVRSSHPPLWGQGKVRTEKPRLYQIMKQRNEKSVTGSRIGVGRQRCTRLSTKLGAQ